MFKHVTTGVIFNNRKEAVKLMGQSRYKKALANHEFVFDYLMKEDELPIRSIYT